MSYRDSDELYIEKIWDYVYIKAFLFCFKLDGFDSRGDVKVIMATNRIDSLDPALIRPGRIDRKIEFPLPDDKTRKRIFHIHTNRMTLAQDVNIDEYISAKEDLSGADIKAICTEAGLMALR